MRVPRGTFTLLAALATLPAIHAFHTCTSLTATRVATFSVINQTTMGISPVIQYPNSPEIQWPTMFCRPSWVVSMTNSPFAGTPSTAKAVASWGRHHGTRLYWGWSTNMLTFTFPKSITTYPNSNGGDLRVVWKENVALKFGTSALNHMSSPDFYFDEATKTIYMFFHVAGLATSYVPTNFNGSTYKNSGQATLVSKWDTTLSKFVIVEKAGATYYADHRQRAYYAAVAPYYFRSFKYNGIFYGLGREGGAGTLLLKSTSGSVVGPYKVFKRVLGTSRHTAVYLSGSFLSIGYSKIYTTVTPEKALMKTVDILNSNPVLWDFDSPKEFTLLTPSLWWEGGNLTQTAPLEGAAETIVRHIRDPAPFYDCDGKARLAYCGGGEYAIGLANLTCA